MILYDLNIQFLLNVFKENFTITKASNKYFFIILINSKRIN